MFSDSEPVAVFYKKLNRRVTVRFRWLLQEVEKKDPKEEDRYEWRKISHYYLRPGGLSIGREERKAGLWQMERTADGTDHVYMSCYWCGAVNDFSDHEVGPDGFVFPCVVCRECDHHEFVCLDGWTYGERKEIKRDRIRKV